MPAYVSLIVHVVPGLAWRIIDEEKLLKKNLPGYVEYVQEVRYRLCALPLVRIKARKYTPNAACNRLG